MYANKNSANYWQTIKMIAAAVAVAIVAYFAIAVIATAPGISEKLFPEEVVFYPFLGEVSSPYTHTCDRDVCSVVIGPATKGFEIKGFYLGNDPHLYNFERSAFTLNSELVQEMRITAVAADPTGKIVTDTMFVTFGQ